MSDEKWFWVVLKAVVEVIGVCKGVFMFPAVWEVEKENMAVRKKHSEFVLMAEVEVIKVFKVLLMILVIVWEENH